MNLKELARSRGTNLKQIAEKCNIPASTLYAISSGDTNFDHVGISTFMQIANALDLSAEDLYRGDSEKTTEYRYVFIVDEKKEMDELAEIMRSITKEGRRQLMVYARGIAATYPKSASSEIA